MALPCKECICFPRCKNRSYFQLIILCEKLVKHIYLGADHKSIIKLYADDFFHNRDKNVKSIKCKIMARRKVKALRFLYGTEKAFLTSVIFQRFRRTNLRYEVFLSGHGFCDVTRIVTKVNRRIEIE